MSRVLSFISIFILAFAIISCDDKDTDTDIGTGYLTEYLVMQSDLDYGDIGVSVPVALTLTITNNTGINITNLSYAFVNNAGGIFEVANAITSNPTCTTNLPNLHNCDLTFTALSANIGEYKGTLQVTGGVYTKVVSLEADVFNGATLNATAIRLYDRNPIGVNRAINEGYIVKIQNNGTADLSDPLTIRLINEHAGSYTISNLGDGCSGKILTKSHTLGGVADACLIKLDVLPKVEGINKAKLYSSSGVFNDGVTLSINGTYGGSVFVMNQVINFGNITLGDPLAHMANIAVFNIGYAEVTDFSWQSTLSGANFIVQTTEASDGNICTNVLGVNELLNANCAIRLNFSASGLATGSYTSSIDIGFLGKTFTVPISAKIVD